VRVPTRHGDERRGDHEKESRDDGTRATRLSRIADRDIRRRKGRSTTRSRRGRRRPLDDVVEDARGADDQGSAAVRRAIALVDPDRGDRRHRAACDASQLDQCPAIGGTVALGDRCTGRACRERIAAGRDAAARTVALVLGVGRRVRVQADEVVVDEDAAAKRAAAAVDRIVALGDLGDRRRQVLRRCRAGRLRIPCGAVALADRDRGRSTARRDRVDDIDPADHPEAGRVVLAVPAGRRRGDDGSGGRGGRDQARARQKGEGEEAGDEESERATHRDTCRVERRGQAKVSSGPVGRLCAPLRASSSGFSRPCA